MQVGDHRFVKPILQEFTRDLITIKECKHLKFQTQEDCEQVLFHLKDLKERYPELTSEENSYRSPRSRNGNLQIKYYFQEMSWMNSSDIGKLINKFVSFSGIFSWYQKYNK